MIKRKRVDHRSRGTPWIYITRPPGGYDVIRDSLLLFYDFSPHKHHVT